MPLRDLPWWSPMRLYWRGNWRRGGYTRRRWARAWYRLRWGPDPEF